MFKILGSYVWMSGLVSALLTLILSFFLQPNIVSTLPLVLFFVTLAVRSVIFAVREVRSFIKQSEEETVLREA
jgi:hypothetical protein